MSREITDKNNGTAQRPGLRWPYVVLIIIVTMAVTAGITFWLLSNYFFIKEFTPVRLKPEEQKMLDRKLRTIKIEVNEERTDVQPPKPERYSEVGARRRVEFSERELNAMLANNTNLARKLAIDLSEDMVSAKILLPVDKDFPILGGKTLHVHAGMELAYRQGRPVVVLKGVSVMGVPLPNAWLGNLKNVDLAREFGGDQGFWKAFSEGIEFIRVKEKQLVVKLKK